MKLSHETVTVELKNGAVVSWAFELTLFMFWFCDSFLLGSWDNSWCRCSDEHSFEVSQIGTKRWSASFIRLIVNQREQHQILHPPWCFTIGNSTSWWCTESKIKEERSSCCCSCWTWQRHTRCPWTWQRGPWTRSCKKEMITLNEIQFN